MRILSEYAIYEHYRRCFKKDALNMDPDKARAYTAAELRLALDIFRLKGELKLADHKGLRWVFRSEDVEVVRIWRANRGISLEEFGEALEILQEGGQS